MSVSIETRLEQVGYKFMGTKPQHDNKYDQERMFQYNLAQLFTKREKEVIVKMLRRQILTETEQQLKSRRIMKKVNAIISLEKFALCVRGCNGK